MQTMTTDPGESGRGGWAAPPAPPADAPERPALVGRIRGWFDDVRVRLPGRRAGRTPAPARADAAEPDVAAELEATLRAKVEHEKRAAVTQGLAPSASPPGDAVVDDAVASARRQLDGRHRREAGARRDRLAQVENLLALAASGLRLPLPIDYPVAFVFPWEWVVILLVFGPETDVLARPIGTMLDLPDGDPIRWVIAGVLVLAMAIAGHWSGKLLLLARRADVATDVRLTRSMGWVAGVVVLGIASLAVYARYQAALKARADGQGAVDVTEIAFFAGFQLLLALAAIGLGWIHAWRVDRAKQLARPRYLSDLDTERVELSRLIADEPHEHADQHARLEELGNEYRWAYRDGIAEGQRDLESELAWRERNARDRAAATGHPRSADPSEPPSDDRPPPPPSGQGPGPGGSEPPPADGPATTPPNPGPAQGDGPVSSPPGAEAQPDRDPEDREPPSQEEDLFHQIITPPPT